MISVESLSKKYGGLNVLDLQELTIPKGEIFGLIGNNGAGKTTFFSLLLDLIESTSGTVLINEINVQKSEAWKPFTSAFIDESYLIGYLTVEEYYHFIGALRGMTKEEVDAFVVPFEPFFNSEVLNQKKIFERFFKRKSEKSGDYWSIDRTSRIGDSRRTLCQP